MNISEEAYKEIFNHSPLAKLIIDTAAPDYTIIEVNNACLQLTNISRAEIIGRPVFLVFPKNTSGQHAKHIEATIQSSKNTYRYIEIIIQYPHDITAQELPEERENEGLAGLNTWQNQLYASMMQAPVGIGIFVGPEFRVSMMNPELCKLCGKAIEEMIDKPIFEVLSFAKGLGFEELLDHVRLSGETYEGIGVEIPLIRDGILEKVYVDFVYRPFYGENNVITGVIASATEVTAKVEAMRKLEEAEERARLAADAVDLGVFDLNFINGEMITSQRFANILGFKKPSLRNQYIKAFHPEDLPIRKKAHEDAIEQGTMNYEARVIWPDQSVHWIRVEGKVLYDQAQNPVRLLGTLLDITGQKWNKEQQRKLITLVDNSVDLMSIFNLDGLNTYINAAGVELLGLETLEKAQEIHLSDLHNPLNYEFVQNEILPTVIRDGKWAGNIMVRNFSTGEIIPVFNNCIRIDDRISGKPIAIGAVMRDLRQELNAKQALAESERLLRNITTAAPTALWMSNKKGEITYVNQTWVDWTGNTFEENQLYGWMDVVNPEDLKLVAEGFRDSIYNRNKYEVEFRINHADGTIHWCVAHGQPQFDHNGRFSGYIGSCTDITEIKELQNQKDNFIGIASHELKTPVTSLKGYAQVMERILKKKGHEAEADMMRKMDTQLNRLSSLISDLLDVTKINSGKLQFNNQVFELQPVISELVQDLQRSTDKHLLVENYNSAGKTFADKDRIEQVVINLLTNAIKYSPESGEIIIHMNQVDNDIIVGVEDFGVGISAEDTTRVFEQFYRASGKMQHTFPGLGLGLYITAEIIKRAGGKIWAERKEQAGTCFYFSLPVYD